MIRKVLHKYSEYALWVLAKAKDSYCIGAYCTEGWAGKWVLSLAWWRGKLWIFPYIRVVPEFWAAPKGRWCERVLALLKFYFVCHKVFMLLICIMLFFKLAGRKKGMLMKYGSSPLSVWVSPVLLVLLILLGFSSAMHLINQTHTPTSISIHLFPW